MKRILIVLLAMVFMVGFAGMAIAADIAGSKHDFSATGSGEGQGENATGEICNTCHAPHNPSNASDGPLWDHVVTGSSFTGYADVNDTINATDINDTIGGVSKLCLSCHDGSVAIDSFGGVTGGTSITGVGLLSTDLSDDHPVSFTYDTTLANADTELTDPASAAQVGTDDLPLFEGTQQMECATCHNAHDGAATYFLRVANVGSALCKNCHIK
jgi:predicted CXXCH cytochrome family protein